MYGSADAHIAHYGMYEYEWLVGCFLLWAEMYTYVTNVFNQKPGQNWII